MTDILTTIETQIKTVLESIQVPLSATSGYDYYTNCGTVNIEDEALSLSTNTDQKMVNYVVYLEDEVGDGQLQLGNCMLTNTVGVKICARVHQDDSSTNPKFDITKKMNECLSDLKYAFSQNPTLNGKCEIIIYSRSLRTIHPTNNRIQTGDLECWFSVLYTQSMKNPNLLASR